MFDDLNRKKIEMNAPEKMVEFLNANKLDEEQKLLQLALLLYPYIENETISYGYASKLLGINRLNLIEMYGRIGIPYVRLTIDELHEESISYDKALKSELKNILEHYVDVVKGIYSNHLEKVILFGSYARGDYRADSDVDVMLLLDINPKQERKEIKKLLDSTYDFNMEHDVDIQPIPKSLTTFEKWKSVLPFYKAIATEGIVVYE